MTISTAEFGLLVRRSLEHGVPVEIVAQVFELDPGLVAEMQREVRVEQFGTSDQAEFLDMLQWRTLQRAAWLMEHGSPAEATRIATAVLGRQVVAASKKKPEETQRALVSLAEAMEHARTGTAPDVTPGRFVLGPAGEDG